MGTCEQLLFSTGSWLRSLIRYTKLLWPNRAHSISGLILVFLGYFQDIRRCLREWRFLVTAVMNHTGFDSQDILRGTIVLPLSTAISLGHCRHSCQAKCNMCPSTAYPTKRFQLCRKIKTKSWGQRCEMKFRSRTTLRSYPSAITTR
ncbi:hypothetical protein SDC9_62632 [bioreactor metagenome]|uniref:Uncharacterized protein n=1 Tax=bioreactor metagenome TaxID=1076179 RepID=A0A644XQ83_9ZZZZ